jgi:acyl dehydratase
VVLDRSFIGRSFSPGEPYVVGIEKIREFATAIGDDNPISHSTSAAQAAGHDALVAPPTFAIAAAAAAQDAVLFDPALGLDFSRVVHGEQRFVHHRAILAGDVLVCTVFVDAIRALGSNDVLTLRAELSLESGTPVSTAVSNLVARGTAS